MRNRVFAGLLAVLLVLTSFTWSSNSIIGVGANNDTPVPTAETDKKIFAFDDIDVKTLEEAGFTSSQFNKNKNYEVISADQGLSGQWFTGKKGTNASGGSISSGNSGLKSVYKDSNKIASVLNTPYAYENFHVKAEIYWGVNTGIIFGEKNVYPRSTTGYSSVSVYFANNRIQVGGALDYSSASVTGREKGWTTWNTTGIYYFADNFKAVTNQVYTLNVKVEDNVLSVWVDGYETLLTVNLAEHYKTGTIALMNHKYDGDGGGIKSVEIEELKVEEAQVGDSFREEFLPSDTSFEVSSLDKDFRAYYLASSEAEAVKSAPSTRWTDTKWGLRPNHNRKSGAHTLLTYAKLTFRNVEVTAKYQRNWGQYTIMIAPEGELAAVGNHGIKAWVESNGRIRVTGAIDAGTAVATGGYATILGQNMIAGYDIADYSANATDGFYNLHVRIDGQTLSIWMDEFPQYIISVQVTEDYQGGFVSLYSNGNNDGGFGAFSAEEIQGATEIEGVYKQSFNTISSLDELKDDFATYTLDSAENQPTEAGDISELFVLKGGRLLSNRPAAGSNDRTEFSLLTLTKKQYTNFELVLKYEQNRMQRYGVMFGTEKGEFAYTQKGNRLEGNGGVFAYTEAEGYRNVRGSLYTSSYTDASEALHRDRGDARLDSFWWNNNDLDGTLNKQSIHTMMVRVVDGYMTMVIDNNKTSRVTVRLADYEGGYISLVTNAKAGAKGAFLSLTVRELEEGAELGADKNQTPENFGYETLQEVEKDFAAYHLADATVTGKMDKVDLKDRWYLNDGGILTRTTTYDKSITWKYAETKDVDVLTYTKQQYTDFELTYTYQQTARRMGVVIGGDLGVYPLEWQNDKLVAEKGAIFYLEAEGYSNIKGHLNNVTSTDTLSLRNTVNAPDGFMDASGNTVPYEGTLHTVKIIVKDKRLYAFVDGGTDPVLYVKLGSNYTGGYISLFSHANSWHGFKNFTITDNVSTALPTGGGTSVSGNTFTADFNTAKFDDSAFTTYYLAHTKGNAEGAMEKRDFEEQWTLNNGHLESNRALTAPSSKNMGTFEYDDSTMVSVLEYNKKLTDFVATYDYQKTPKRLMFMFGTQQGKFALRAPNTSQFGQGILLYPENDLGAGGGLVALGNLATYNSEMRPMARTLVKLEGYHVAGKWSSNVGSWHTMTVAVISGHCYIWLDDSGMIADYELTDYEGGYISLAATGRGAGFDNLKITDLSGLADDSVVSVETPRDITVAVGTQESALNLPSSLTVTMKNGQTKQVGVDWKSLNYQADTAGVYEFTALVDETARVGARIRIRVVETLPSAEKGVKYWSFDTQDDLADFTATYIKDKESGAVTENVPNWYVSSSGKLTRDAYRAVNGDTYKEIAILTYNREAYVNFELEVEYTQQWQRLMVLFGSEKVGSYIDLNDIYAESNPVAAYVEMEGVRNFIGNLRNANFDTNDKEKINSARETGIRLKDYYDTVLYGGNQGKKHTMKVRVVGDQAMLWVDDCEEPYVCTLTNYDGGYISLATTCKKGSFDNLKITRLNEQGEPEVAEQQVAANGTLGVAVDETADTELKIPESIKPEGYRTNDDKQTEAAWSIPAEAYIIGGGVILLAAVLGAVMILVARRKNKENKEHKEN